MLIDEVCMYTEEYLEEIEKMKSMDQPIILFGAGSTSEINLQYFRDKEIFPVAFCDNSKEKSGKKVDDIEIVLFERSKELFPNAYYYITTQLYYSQIKQQLLEGGIREENISNYDIVFQFQWESSCIEYYKRHESDIQVLYERLEDEESKKVLKNRLLFLRTRNRKYATAIRRMDQYFDKEIVEFHKVKYYLDAGMYTGDTISSFIEVVEGNYKEIFGFEPDEKIFKQAQNNLKTHDNITLIPMATSEYDGSVQVECALGVMQTIEKGIFTEDQEKLNSFKVCRIDSCFAGKTQKIDMIKMDVEGAEMSSLRGAQNTIKENRPVMAICVYHKEEDILEIPKYIESLGITCKIYLRHYSDNQTETVCYLIPKNDI
ncbi:MAG: FkbM family methyltransferase [Clostridiales bacterium]|nr:FkbM family methyltransferase [Clostridiales bacterium]